VIPGDDDLHHFLSIINEKRFQNSLNLIHFSDYPKKRSKSNRVEKIVRLLPEIVGERRYLNKIYYRYFYELKEAEVYFFTRVMNPTTFFFLNKIKGQNRLVYMHYAPYVDKLEKYSPHGISEWVTLMVYKLTYSAYVVMGKLPHVKGFPFIPDKFMEQEVNEIVTQERRNVLLKGYQLNQFEIFNEYKYSIVYFDQPIVNKDRIADINVFRKELKEIFSVLTKHFKAEQIAIKYHPKYESDRTLINIGQVLPKFIPAEYFYNDSVKAYLSLFSCAIANVEKGLAISLANLITFRSDEIREQLKETLIRRSRSTIMFPESLEEFDRVLTNLTKRND
jgi:hypothetical protein